jgi:hypothetical protein
LTLPFFCDNRLQVVGFCFREIVEEINDGPDHGDHEDEHHGGQKGEDRPHLIAKEVLKDEEKELHCCLLRGRLRQERQILNIEQGILKVEGLPTDNLMFFRPIFLTSKFDIPWSKFDIFLAIRTKSGGQ